MFASLHNQKKAESLIAEARHAVDEADATYRAALDRIHRVVSAVDDVRSHLAQKTLGRFRERFTAIENEHPVELPPVSQTPFAQQLEPLFQKGEEVTPVTIENVRRGKAGAFFGSLLAVAVTFVAAMVIGAVGSGLPLSPETFTDKYKILHILEWLGGGAFHTLAANPIFGAIGLLIAMVAVWTITSAILMGKAARRNLQRAEATHQKALAYVEARNRFAEIVERLARELDALEETIETCDIYLQEYNASLKRILHTEGSDYITYRPASKHLVDRAAECAEAVTPLLNIAIVTTEGTPSAQLEEAIAYGRTVVEALKEEREIPDFKSFEYAREKEENREESNADEAIALPSDEEQRASLSDESQDTSASDESGTEEEQRSPTAHQA